MPILAAGKTTRAAELALRPQLRDCWDIAIFVDAGPDEVLRRALVRDARLMGAPAARDP